MSYSCSVGKTGKGGSVASSAYRSAELLYDERTGRTWDYRRKRGVVASFIAAPEGCDWARHRNSLWNAAEAAERRQRATVAREWRLALPAELSAEHREALARAFAVELVARYGVAADVAVHLPSATGDQRNHHAHILTTSRVVEPEGLGKKTRVLDDLKTGPVEITAMRAVWAGLCNEALERAGSAERVDHRSLKAQRAEALAAGDLVRAAELDRAPTRHRGPKREHAAGLRDARAAQLAAEAAERARAEAAARAERERAEAERLEAARRERERAAQQAAERAAAEEAARKAAARPRPESEADRLADAWWAERVAADPVAAGIAVSLVEKPGAPPGIDQALDQAWAMAEAARAGADDPDPVRREAFAGLRGAFGQLRAMALETLDGGWMGVAALARALRARFGAFAPQLFEPQFIERRPGPRVAPPAPERPVEAPSPSGPASGAPRPAPAPQRPPKRAQGLSGARPGASPPPRSSSPPQAAPAAPVRRPAASPSRGDPAAATTAPAPERPPRRPVADRSPPAHWPRPPATVPDLSALPEAELRLRKAVVSMNWMARRACPPQVPRPLRTLFERDPGLFRTDEVGAVLAHAARHAAVDLAPLRGLGRSGEALIAAIRAAAELEPPRPDAKAAPRSEPAPRPQRPDPDAPAPSPAPRPRGPDGPGF